MIRFASELERATLALKYQDSYYKCILEDEDNSVYVKAIDDEILGVMVRVPYNYYLNGKMIRCSEIVDIAYDEDVYNAIIDHLSHQELLSFSLSRLEGMEMAVKMKEYVVHLHELPLLNTYGISYEEDINGMLECYGKYISHFNAYPVYDLKGFDKHIRQLKMMGYRIISYYRNGFVRGFMAYINRGEYLYCDEVYYLDSRSLITMMAHLLNNRNELHLVLAQNENLDFIKTRIPYNLIEGPYALIHEYGLLNRLYNSSIRDLSQALALKKRPVYFKAHKR